MSFKRENRYLVFKIKDIKKYLDDTDLIILAQISNKIHTKRIEDGREALEAVVVESDWDIYERVWDFIEAEELRDG